MAGSILTSEERYKFSIMTQVINNEMKSGQAAMLLGISPRQIRRLKIAVKKDKEKAIIHGLKNKQSNFHNHATGMKDSAVLLIGQKYPDFKPTFATEKLAEHHGITVSAETTRRWMTSAGLWKTRKQKQAVYHSWRPRKAYFGELQQFDGSYHYWFENRFFDTNGDPIEVCLLASIDDATGEITKAVFAANEGVAAVFTFWKEYVENIGKPMHIYLDKFSTYKINHKAAVDNHDLITQFHRAMQTLEIELIFAHSPQAKGRVERLFQTLQDRLVKEMRLANITTPEQGNIFLETIFIPKFNEQFARVPTQNGDVHKLLVAKEIQQMNHIFSIHETRRVNHDFTIQFKNKWYQLTEIQPTTVRPLEKIIVTIWLDTSIHITLKKYELAYILLPAKPLKRKTQPIIVTTHKLNYKPPKNHPWRQYKIEHEKTDISTVD